ncbi:MAG: bifunctional phosphoribosylaminoimidazolecarboxamide formyltransferase/IMP cyclohydrolase [Candidatus Rokubacteria bacterium]|nr:bifunctional phosphoribosylaminoimidazolecarboxamide formyltransferase/IMP cyclohydrolase [Candidatus Rokubacteria bacterium]
MSSIKRALVSVHDKAGVVDLARGLVALGAEILSTGGTAKVLREAGIPLREVSEVTGAPEMLDGRVKTLHPKIHAAILARREKPEHLAQLQAHGIPPIDLVAINLYPFEQTVARPGVEPDEAVEQIDIGGPTLIRAAAKNWESVVVLTDPGQYTPVLDELRQRGGLSRETRYRLAREAFRRTAQYDAAIAAWFRDPQAVPRSAQASAEPAFPPVLKLEAELLRQLRYGENPHQSAAFYRLVDASPFGLAAARQLHGPELSYNNLLDASAALGLVMEFDEPAAVVIKHTNPCGVGLGASVAEALGRAKASDPVSIFGGIVGVNRPLELEAVKQLAGILIEVLIAPSYASAALEELRRTKQKCRVLELPCDRRSLLQPRLEYRSVPGGLLVQDADAKDLDEGALTVVSRRPPTAEEWAGLRFAWKVAKHVKSNAIVLATRDQLIGVGAGQMSRVDAARLAVLRAKELGLETRGTVCASDAFFPFRDGLDVVAQAGATAVIHPGGSVRDQEVIACADEHGMAMVLTGIRHFRH